MREFNSTHYIVTFAFTVCLYTLKSRSQSPMKPLSSEAILDHFSTQTNHGDIISELHSIIVFFSRCPLSEISSLSIFYSCPQPNARLTDIAEGD